MTRFVALALLAAWWLAGATAAAALPLWELEGTGNHIRLLGSIHFLRADDYPLPEPVQAAYRDADVLVMELDLDDLDPTDAQAVIGRLSVDPDGRDLVEILGRDGYREAATRASRMDIDLAAMQRYEPWYAALQVTQLRLAQLGFQPAFGVETQFLIKARGDGREVRGLETLERQLGALDSLDADAQRRFLMRTLEEAAEIEGQMDGILEAWRTGDTSRLEEELLAGLEEQPELYDRILVARNRAWSRAILGLVDDGTDYLIIVGTLHLVGEDSVLALLEAAGVGYRQLGR